MGTSERWAGTHALPFWSRISLCVCSHATSMQRALLARKPCTPRALHASLAREQAVRTDDNDMLKMGVAGAFVVTRSWALLDAPAATCTAMPLNCGPPLGFFNWDMIGSGILAAAQTACACAGAAFAIEFCFNRGWIRRCE